MKHKESQGEDIKALLYRPRKTTARGASRPSNIKESETPRQTEGETIRKKENGRQREGERQTAEGFFSTFHPRPRFLAPHPPPPRPAPDLPCHQRIFTHLLTYLLPQRFPLPPHPAALVMDSFRPHLPSC